MMVSKHPQTFIKQMSRKYPEVKFELVWPDLSTSGVIIATHNDKSIQVSVFKENEKLVFKNNNRGNDDQKISFRKTMSSFIKPIKSKGNKIEIQEMIKSASDIELELVWIPRMMERQVEDEVQHMETHDKNGVGLNRADAWPITRAYKRIQKGGHLYGDEPKDIKNRLLKYWKQYSSLKN